MKKRIKDTPVPTGDYRNEFFNTYRKVIEFYFGNPKEETVYVDDPELERELIRLILNQEDKIIYFLGKEGIGKTTLLKNVLGISDNAIVFDEIKDTVYIPINFRGLLVETDIKQFIINSISCLCTALEERYGFREKVYSVEGHNAFYDYVKKTDSSLLEYISSVELIGKSNQEIRLFRLMRGEEMNPYAYLVSKLNYYLNFYCTAINNVVIVVDNIEALSKEARCTAVRDILGFFSYMLRDSADSMKKNQVINLILSMRELTYEELIEREEINAYKPRIILRKDKPVDMMKYFALKRETIVEKNGMEQIWDDAYEIIMTLANKFSCKYSEMIKNLCNYDFELMKKSYKKVLTNKVWLLRGERRKDFLNMSKTDYLFNNISVLRSVACGNNAVYRGMKSVVVPNVMLNDEFHDDSMICLLLMNFMMREQMIVIKRRLFDAFQWIFGEKLWIMESLNRTVEYFLNIGVLEETYYEKKTTSQNKYLSITPRGKEIWNLFKADSVILEMYKEDYYFSEEEQGYDFSSSFYLMNTVGQYEVFIQLFHYINILLKKEKKLHGIANENGKLEEYYSCFGKKIQAKRLMEGVIKSIEYSGNMYTYDIQNEIATLEMKIRNIDK